MTPTGTVGRNESCWCGSGVKYKKCHLDADRATLAPAPAVEFLSWSIARAAKRPGFAVQAMEPAMHRRQALLATVGEGLDGKDAAFALRDFLMSLEDELAGILRRRSAMFWLQILRRMPPDPIGVSTSWTVHLYRRIADLAVIKHASSIAGDGERQIVIEGITEDPANVLPNFNAQDVLDAARVEYLAYEYNAAASAFRRVGKGARLGVISGDFRAIAGDRLNDRIAEHDRRVARYGSLVGPAGADVDFDADLDANPLVLVSVMPNASRSEVEWSRHITGGLLDGPANFRMAPLTVDAARDVLLKFDDALAAAFGVSADALLASIWGLTTKVVSSLGEDPRIAMQLLRTGYLPFSNGERMDGVRANVADLVQHWWSDILDKQVSHGQAVTIVEDAFAALTWTDDVRSSIDLWSRTPPRMFIDTGKHTLIDFAAIPYVVNAMFVAVGFIENDAGGVKGQGFEDAINRRAAEHGLTPWHTGKVTNPAGDELEVDTSFVVGTTLYLVEAKAYSQAPRVDQGDFAALKGRWEKLRDRHLAQAKRLRDFIDADRVGRNYRVPSEVTHIEYVVCTPAVEWIADDDPAFWVTDNIPRICTPDELVIMLGAAGTGS